jgi:hypothetical protein
MTRKRGKDKVVEPPAPLSNEDVGRLLIAFGACSHGYDNRIVVSALLQFASSWLVTQVLPRMRSRMVDKFCDDLMELVADKEAKLRAHDQTPVGLGAAIRSIAHPRAQKGKTKAAKARAIRR